MRATIFMWIGIFVLCVLSCSDEKESPRMKAGFRQDWEEMSMLYEVPVFVHDTTGIYISESDYYRTIVPLWQLPEYKTLEEYVYQNTQSSSLVVRLINELGNYNFKEKDSVIIPDTVDWYARTPYSLFEVCWLVQDTPDTVRFIYLRDTKGKDIVDTSLYYTDTYVQEILSYLGQQKEKNSNKGVLYSRRPPRPLSTVLSVWWQGKSFHYNFGKLWYYSECKSRDNWGFAPDVDSALAITLLRMTCQVRSVGGFHKDYGYYPIAHGGTRK